MHTVVFGWFGASAVWFIPLLWRVAKSVLPGGVGLRGPGTIRLWLGFICVLVASCTLEASLVSVAGADGLGHALAAGFGKRLGHIGTPLATLALLVLSLPWLLDFRWSSVATWADSAFGLGLTRGLAKRDEDARRRSTDDTLPAYASTPTNTMAPRTNGRHARPTVWRPPVATRGTAGAAGAAGAGSAAGAGNDAQAADARGIATPGSASRQAKNTAQRGPASPAEHVARTRVGTPVRQGGSRAQTQTAGAGLDKAAPWTPAEPVAPAGWLGDPATTPRGAAQARNFSVGGAGGIAGAGGSASAADALQARSVARLSQLGAAASAAGLSGSAAGAGGAADAPKAFVASRPIPGPGATPASTTGAARVPSTQNPAQPVRASSPVTAPRSAPPATPVQTPRPASSATQTPRRPVVSTSRAPSFSRPAATTQRVTPPASVQETLRSIEENAARWTTIAGASLARRSGAEASMHKTDPSAASAADGVAHAAPTAPAAETATAHAPSPQVSDAPAVHEPSASPEPVELINWPIAPSPIERPVVAEGVEASVARSTELAAGYTQPAAAVLTDGAHEVQPVVAEPPNAVVEAPVAPTPALAASSTHVAASEPANLAQSPQPPAALQTEVASNGQPAISTPPTTPVDASVTPPAATVAAETATPAIPADVPADVPVDMPATIPAAMPARVDRDSAPAAAPTAATTDVPLPRVEPIIVATAAPAEIGAARTVTDVRAETTATAQVAAVAAAIGAATARAATAAPAVEPAAGASATHAPTANVIIDKSLVPWETKIDAVAARRAASSTAPAHATAATISAAVTTAPSSAAPTPQAASATGARTHDVSTPAAPPAPDITSAQTEAAPPQAAALSNVVRFPGLIATNVAARAEQHTLDAVSQRAAASAATPTSVSATLDHTAEDDARATAHGSIDAPLVLSRSEPANEPVAPRSQVRGHAPTVFEFRAPAASMVELPTLDLLARADTDVEPVSEERLAETGALIEQRLQEFKVPVTVVGASAGPVITRFEVEPALGVRGSQIVGLMKDLSRGLGLTSIRVVETIPGKTCMGLELPNAKRQTIRLSEILEANVYQHSHSMLTLAMGKDITGHPVVADLAKAPHMLVAGTTGSGKSVAINAMIVSLLYKATPEEVRLIMIDPKMLELSVYEGIPHLLAPVVTDMKLAANALNWCVGEMEKRYRLMSAVGVRNLAGFNQKIRDAEAAGKKLGNPFSLTPEAPEPLSTLPLIVVVIDELADLMMVAGKKIEELIARLAQKARAAGIHLILATQRPSVDVITGLIKANIPTRVAFQVSSKIDSRTILDQMGAESLLGQGDMLFLPPGTGYPQRVHGAFVADEEVHRIVEYLKQFGEPQYEDGILDGPATEGATQDLFGETPDAEADPLYDEAVAFVVRTRRASISSVQRQLRIGYNRAARLVEQMETAGLVSSMGINGSREVLAPGPAE